MRRTATYVEPLSRCLDPAFTLATGRELSASTAIKALDHAVESVYSVKHNAFTDALCLEAVRLLVAHLELSVAEPEDLLARLALQRAASLACYGITNTWVGLGHALCHQVGVESTWYDLCRPRPLGTLRHATSLLHG